MLLSRLVIQVCSFLWDYSCEEVINGERGGKSGPLYGVTQREKKLPQVLIGLTSLEEKLSTVLLEEIVRKLRDLSDRKIC